MDDDTRDVDPRDMLALLEEEKARTQQALGPDPRVVFGAWGMAWLLSFLTLWAAASDESPVDVAMPVAAVFSTICLVTAMVLTIVHIGRRTVGLRGVSSTTGALYGWAWFLGFAALTAIMQGGIRAGMPEETMALLWPSLAGLVVGLLYMAGGALWQDRLQFGLGAWILISSAAAAFAGYPSVYLVMAFGGGGGFLLAAAFFALRKVRR